MDVSKTIFTFKIFYNNEILYFNEETGPVVMWEKELHSYKTNAVLVNKNVNP